MARRKDKRKFWVVITNVWKDKRTTVLGVIGASLVILGQYLITGERIDWRAVIGAGIIALAGALTNLNTNKSKNHGNKTKEADEIMPRADFPADDNNDIFMQPEDSRYYKDL